MDRLPVEILLRIYEHCDQFRQATSLSSVNKRWRSMWEDKMPTILWHVGTASVVGFNDALMAARATTIVKEQIQAGKLPPHPFPLPSLRDPKVSLDELMAVFDLQHLAECLEYKQCHQTDWDTDNDLTVDAIWRERFRQSLYRVFLAAAALTGAYQEPFLKQTDDCPKSFVKGYKDELIEDPDVQNFAEVLTSQDFRYLLQFPVYNFQDYERHDDTYGRLAEFLFQLSQERACHEGMEDNALDRLLSDHSPEARVLFHETSQLLVAFECLQENTVRSELGHDAMGGTGRKALIVSLGSFFPVEFDLPLCSANVDPTGLAYKNITVDKPPEVHYLGPLDILLDFVFRESGQPNYYDTTCPAPAPPLQFFEYMYRKYLGLRFSKSAFEESKYAPYPRWVADANVFFDSFRMWSDSFDGALVADTPLPAFYRR